MKEISVNPAPSQLTFIQVQNTYKETQQWKIGDVIGEEQECQSKCNVISHYTDKYMLVLITINGAIYLPMEMKDLSGVTEQQKKV